MSQWLIVGAGPSGLAAARAFREAEVPFDVVERHRDVGGIWDIENPGTPMYETAHFISSKTQSEFDGYPMPRSYPDYPSQRAHPRLHPRVRRRVRAAPAHPDRRRGRREPRRTRAPSGTSSSHRQSGDAIAASSRPSDTTGIRSSRAIPARSPARRITRFDTARRPSSTTSACSSSAAETRRATSRATRRRARVGRSSPCAAATTFSRSTSSASRRTSSFAAGRSSRPRVAQPLLTGLLRFLVGDLRRFGLPAPDHRVLESHPIMNTQILHFLAHGDVAAKPDVVRLDGRRVHFADGIGGGRRSDRLGDGLPADDSLPRGRAPPPRRRRSRSCSRPSSPPAWQTSSCSATSRLTAARTRS